MKGVPSKVIRPNVRAVNFGCYVRKAERGCSNTKDYRKLFKSTLNNRLHRNLACVIDKSSRGAKLKRAFEELPTTGP